MCIVGCNKLFAIHTATMQLGFVCVCIVGCNKLAIHTASMQLGFVGLISGGVTAKLSFIPTWNLVNIFILVYLLLYPVSSTQIF